MFQEQLFQEQEMNRQGRGGGGAVPREILLPNIKCEPDTQWLSER